MKLPVAPYLLAFMFFLAGSLHAQQHAGMSYELKQLSDPSYLPVYRPDTKVYQVSSYDTTGGNDDGFGGTFSFVRKEGGFNVLADLSGPGVVNRIATPTPTNGMLAFYFDGESTPRIRVPYIELFSGKHYPFIKPLVGNEVGGYFSFVPIVYSKSLKIVYEGNDMRFHQIQYRSYPAGTNVRSFTTELDSDERKELQAAAATFSKSGDRPFELKEVQVIERNFTLQPGQQVDLFKSQAGGRILGIEMSRPQSSQAILQASWDGEKQLAINSPLNDFFGYAFNEPAAQSLLIGSKAGIDYCYYPMPFERSAIIRLQSSPLQRQAISGSVRIYLSNRKQSPSKEGKFYTTWRRDKPASGTPHLFVDSKGRGHHVGVILQAQGLEEANTAFFEGDEVATADGEMRMHGTGSEDFFNGGWYWILDRWDRAMSLPIHGCLDYDVSNSRTGGYRLYLADKVPFSSSYSFTMEHGPEKNAAPVEYVSVAFHYGTSASASGSNPLLFSAPVVSPPRHHFHARDFSMILDPGTTAHYTAYDQYMEFTSNVPDNSWAVDEIDKTDTIGKVRIEFNKVKPGKYKLLLYYEQGPDGGAFSVWRRQQMISDWKSTNAPAAKLVENAYVGDVEFTEQIKTITLKVKPGGNGRVVRVNRIVLEETR